MNLKGRRRMFEHSRFLLGAYPDRPAPVHLVNGFLCAAFGEGKGSQGVRSLIRDPEYPLPSPPIGEGLRSDGGRTVRFRQAMRVILDPDRRVFPTRGSPFPLHGGFIARDPSDDGFGEAMWEVVRVHAPSAFEDNLRRLLFPGRECDAVSGMGILLAEFEGRKRDGAARKEVVKGTLPWGSNSGELGKLLTRALAALVVQSVGISDGRLRSSRLVTLTQGLFFGTFLAALRAPAIEKYRPKAWEDLAPAFVYGGVPPGDPKEPAVRLAQRSFEAVVDQHRAALGELLVERLKRVRVPARVPSRQQGKVRVRLAFEDLSARQVEEFEEVVGSVSRPEELGKRLLDAVYPAGHLESGFRAMGKKIGFAGPDRGYGSPRLLLETPMLGLLVGTTIGPGERVPYDDWIDRLFDRFGLVLGRGRTDRGKEVLRAHESPGPLHRALEQNQESLRRRLIRSGLAVEYSDAETEVHRYEESS